MQILQDVNGALSALSITEIIGDALNEASVEVRNAKKEIEQKQKLLEKELEKSK